MCGIFGYAGSSFSSVDVHNVMELANANFARGRDAIGVSVVCKGTQASFRKLKPIPDTAFFADLRSFLNLYVGSDPVTVVGNLRAEPTTEYIKNKDVELHTQPFEVDGYSIVHNGIIANDKELSKELGIAGEQLRSGIDSEILPHWFGKNKVFRSPANDKETLNKFHREVKGSYAIAISHTFFPGAVVLLTNYKPLYTRSLVHGILFSSEHAKGVADVQMDQYSWKIKGATFGTFTGQFKRDENKRALAICSGGLDSTVAAATAKAAGFEVTLLHFAYGCKAEHAERIAVAKIGEALGAEVLVIETPMFTDVIKGSPLTDGSNYIAGGIAGAEFAFEWVPARNLVFLSLATAIAESHGYGTLVFGNNLEESGAYPDNEPEFTSRFSNLLPYATAADKHVELLTPVAKLMKHEIVKLGHEVKAPMDLTWSCYHNSEKHCGKCGPCFMRRTAFKINNLPDLVEYQN